MRTCWFLTNTFFTGTAASVVYVSACCTCAAAGGGPFLKSCVAAARSDRSGWAAAGRGGLVGEPRGPRNIASSSSSSSSSSLSMSSSAAAGGLATAASATSTQSWIAARRAASTVPCGICTEIHQGMA